MPTYLVVSALASDGWEFASVYHWMLSRACEGSFVMVMPDLCNADNEPMVYARPYTEAMWSMLDHRRPIRACGFVAFARAAHQIAEQYLANTN